MSVIYIVGAHGVRPDPNQGRAPHAPTIYEILSTAISFQSML
jgi:hypothetical protein